LDFEERPLSLRIPCLADFFFIISSRCIETMQEYPNLLGSKHKNHPSKEAYAKNDSRRREKANRRGT
jgi:hypothetical protein